MNDTYRHKGMRQKLTELLATKGINNQKVLSALMYVPRHLFLDTAFEEQAYKNKALPIASGQTISHPYTVAFQTQLLDPQPTDKILEVGTGSGYQAAILSHLCNKLYTIERHEALYVETARKLNALGYIQIRSLFGDVYKGSPRFAPFDKILVTAGAHMIPQPLLDQLKIGGTLVIPKGSSHTKTMLKITKEAEQKYSTESHGAFQFVPFLEGTVGQPV